MYISCQRHRVVAMFLFYLYGIHRDQHVLTHSLPTRRSSDLFTNIHTGPERYLSANPHFAKSALAPYTPADFITLVDAHGIAWHEKTLGQLFCDGSAKAIVEMLMADAAKGGVEVLCGPPVREDTHAVSATPARFADPLFPPPHLVHHPGG